MFSLSTTYQQAQENLDTLLTQIETENSIGIITRPGHKDIALLPAEELTSLLETIYLLRSESEKLRPDGLCKGEFVTPDDFDDPLPVAITQPTKSCR